jgi:hypothetical protein
MSVRLVQQSSQNGAVTQVQTIECADGYDTPLL